MSIYLQHGHGKGNRITSAVSEGCAQGAILAARSEKPENIAGIIEEIQDADGEVIFDPQFYVSCLSPPAERYLPDYPYYASGLSIANFGTRRVQEYARATLDYQGDFPLNWLVSPTVFFDSFDDRWHQVALNLAEASLEHHSTMSDPAPLLLSFAFAEEALSSREDIDRFLDTITQDEWGMEGIYLVVTRSEPNYCQRFEAVKLANLLYLVHALGSVNGLRVVCGYSDYVGLLLRGVGASVFATGWNHGLRICQRRAFIQRAGGGQRPRLRYSSGPLLNSILLSELHQAYEVGMLEDLLSGVPLDDELNHQDGPEAADWTLQKSQHQHVQALHSLNQRLNGTTRTNFRTVNGWVRTARGLYVRCEAAGIDFESNSDSDHLDEWSSALAQFGRASGLI